jgi:hypothetical protein
MSRPQKSVSGGALASATPVVPQELGPCMDIDNSGAKPAQIAQKIGNTIIVDPAALPEIKEAARLTKSMK